MMGNMFSEIARKETSISPLIEGKSKMSMEEIIKKHPDFVTLNAFDMVASSDGDSYPIFTFDEEPTSFAYGGTILGKICKAWIAHFDGDIETCSKAITANGGVRLRFQHSKTKNGRPITLVECVD